MNGKQLRQMFVAVLPLKRLFLFSSVFGKKKKTVLKRSVVPFARTPPYYYCTNTVYFSTYDGSYSMISFYLPSFLLAPVSVFLRHNNIIVARENSQHLQYCTLRCRSRVAVVNRLSRYATLPVACPFQFYSAQFALKRIGNAIMSIKLFR